MGRFISADAISELDAEEINGLNLYRYCANNPVMMNDTEGNAPAWWEWVVSGILIVVGTVLCATLAGSAFGAGLIAAGGSMMASNIMSAIGVDGKVASIISAGLNIVAGVALCFTPLAALGASMIGSGVGSIGGGFLSEALGFGFQAGAMIGAVVVVLLPAIGAGASAIAALVGGGTAGTGTAPAGAAAVGVGVAAVGNRANGNKTRRHCVGKYCICTECI